jgi:hypothetical protein
MGMSAKSMATVGQRLKQKPQAVHFSVSMMGLNMPLKSMASSIQGSLQEKQITPLCATQAVVEILNFAFKISELPVFTKLNTLTSFCVAVQAMAHASQKVQPDFKKLKVGVPSSCKRIICSSHEATQALLSQFTQTLSKRDSLDA